MFRIRPDLDWEQVDAYDREPNGLARPPPMAACGRLDCLLSNGPCPTGLVLPANEEILFVAMTRDNSVMALASIVSHSVV